MPSAGFSIWPKMPGEEAAAYQREKAEGAAHPGDGATGARGANLITLPARTEPSRASTTLRR